MEPKGFHTADSTCASSEENYLYIILDCYSYIAGDKITGEICFNVTSPIPPASLKFLSRGIERVEVFDPVNKSRQLTEETKEVFAIDEDFKTWDQELASGQYVFPFNFKLPSFAPATFNFSGHDARGHYIKAEVLYYVSAVMVIDGVRSQVSNSRIVVVKNRTAYAKPGASMETSSPVVGCCFVRKGTTAFKLSVTNPDHPSVDGSVMYKLDPDNSHCRAPINHVSGNVVLEFSARTTIGEFKIRRLVNSIPRSAWISAFSDRVYEKDFEYLAELNSSSEELNACSNNGVIISCEYAVETNVFYDLFAVKRPVVLRLPFHVNPRVVCKKEENKLPKEWEPEETPIMHFVPVMKDGDGGQRYDDRMSIN
jgi:hypothetical protein